MIIKFSDVRESCSAASFSTVVLNLTKNVSVVKKWQVRQGGTVFTAGAHNGLKNT
jgi:hypothetical protein